MPLTSDALHLLLADAEAHRPVLEEGLERDAVLKVTEAEHDPNRADVPTLDRRDGDPNDLPAQRWGIVAPEGPEGDALLQAIAPLRALREREQRAPAKIFQLPPDMDAAAAVAWRDKTYRAIPARERPRFLLLLGDLPQLSIELQHVLAHSAFVGRLAFTTRGGQADRDAYEAYAKKVMAAAGKESPTEPPELLLYAAPDDTTATMLGNVLLVRPCHATLSAEWSTRRLGREGEQGEDPRAFLQAAAEARGAVALSVSHGLGRSRSGWATPEAQRTRQGALVLAPGKVLEAEQVRKGAFLQGGLWLCVACFGAATPPRSAFYPWLELLAEHGGPRAAPEVLSSLPKPEQGERPFVAALPQAALANPEGPLAFIGHSDLAWTYGFTDLDDPYQEQSARFAGVLESAARGSRTGVAFDLLMEDYRNVNDGLRADAQARQDAWVFGQPDPVDPKKHGARWLLGNDLRGYVLLGDPAVRLRVQRA